MIEDKVNINGEFLGISSLAVYSAPWYLQLLLLTLVVALFLTKTSRDSRELKSIAKKYTGDELEQFLSNLNQAFFGFAVVGKNIMAYWLGFLIYVVTFAYAAINTFLHIIS